MVPIGDPLDHALDALRAAVFDSLDSIEEEAYIRDEIDDAATWAETLMLGTRRNS